MPATRLFCRRWNRRETSMRLLTRYGLVCIPAAV
jgi:hypothetical protein